MLSRLFMNGWNSSTLPRVTPETGETWQETGGFVKASLSIVLMLVLLEHQFGSGIECHGRAHRVTNYNYFQVIFNNRKMYVRII